MASRYRTADRRRSSLAQVAPTASPSLVPTLRAGPSRAPGEGSAVVFEDEGDGEGDEAEKEREKERREERERRREAASASPPQHPQQQVVVAEDVDMVASTSAS